jgi:hypothetical protein
MTIDHPFSRQGNCFQNAQNRSFHFKATSTREVK